jgi:KDO2-lipid IV(A) lauroyltransferase
MYYVVYGILYLVSLLPIGVLFLLSDLAYFIIYHGIGYRKKIVLQNLAVAFPDKTHEERVRIAKRFYLNFTDNFIETIKFISAGNNWFKRHFKGNVEVLLPIYEGGGKCQVLLAHNFNWELANMAMPLLTPYPLLTVYMPIGNKVIDRLFLFIRTRTGASLVAATRMSREIIRFRNQQYMMALVADQNPGNPANAIWLPFFGKLTPFVTGPEKNAKATNATTVFCFFTKEKRGYYQAHFEVAEKDPRSLAENELTKRYVAYLENVIRKYPDMWLWSHRRWKHEWKPEYGPLPA